MIIRANKITYNVNFYCKIFGSYYLYMYICSTKLNLNDKTYGSTT